MATLNEGLYICNCIYSYMAGHPIEREKILQSRKTMVLLEDLVKVLVLSLMSDDEVKSQPLFTKLVETYVQEKKE